MKIVSIFVHKLFAVHYEGETANEFDRLLDLWHDTSFLYQFLKENESDLRLGVSVKQMAKSLIQDAESIEDTLIDIADHPNKTLDEFFHPLSTHEHQVRVLSLRKGKAHVLRLYAIRLDTNCYLVTGGSIKLTQYMKDRPHTQKEWEKLNQVKDYLKQNGVFDEDSFFELLTDIHNDQ